MLLPRLQSFNAQILLNQPHVAQILFCAAFEMRKLPDGVDWDFSCDISLDLGGVHVRGVLEVSWESVVLTDERVEDFGKVNVGVLISSIHATVLRVKIEMLIFPS